MRHGQSTLGIFLKPELAAKAASGSLSAAEQTQALQLLTDIFNSMAAYVPRGIRADQSRLEKGASTEQTLMLADVTGFTTLSERLSRVGKEGAEEVTGIINSYFSPIIKIVGNYGGDVICFIGDALSISFAALPGEKSPHQLRALKAAQEIQEFVKNFTEVKTSAGVFNLNLHMALHCGPAVNFRLGNPARGSYYLTAGAATNRVSAIEDVAEIGETLISTEMHAAAGGAISAETKHDGIYKFTGVTAAIEPAPSGDITAPQDLEALVSEMELMRPYLSSWVMQKIVADPKGMGTFGEHRRVTAVFLNLWGLDFDGDAQAVPKIQNYFAVLQEAVEKYGGAINKIDFSSTGQRALILFGAPITYENNDERANLFALDMLAHEEFKFGGVKQRFGINSGYVYAGTIGSARRREFTVMGDEVNLAARLMSQAAEEQLLVTAAVNRKAMGKFEVASLGEKEFKGKSLPVAIYQVIKRAEAADSIFGKWVTESKSMVGRQKEKEVLTQSIEKVMAGKGQIVAVVGEPGIGKSRLGRELAQLWLEHGYSMFGGNCQSYGAAISYLPWSDLLETYLGTKKLPTMEDKAAKIERMLGVIDPALKDWAPIVGELVGVWIPETNLTKSLDPKLRQQRLFDLVLDILTWGASQEPLLLVIEDLHWADNASMALLNYVARNIGDKAIMLALLYRPLDAKHEFQSKDYYNDIQLKELSAEESLELVRTLLAIEGMPKELEELILKKSQGNPFFVEEVIKSLIEQKVVVEKDGKWQVAIQEVRNVHIPDTVQGVIMSRIDHLSPEAKDVLQVASVIGRHFAYPVLNAIYAKKTNLPDNLKDLNRFDLILSEQPEQYVFKHIMTQEVAYESLAYSRRRELHNSIGDHLEQVNEKAIDDVLGILAHHYYFAQNWVPAFYYSVEAGDKAKKAYANQEALAHYDRALAVFDKMVEAGILPELERQIKEAEEAEKAKTETEKK